MKPLLNKKLLLCCIAILMAVFAGNAQSKEVADMKWKNNFIRHLKQNQSAKNQGQKFGININPYWKDVNAPHICNSHITQIKVPSFNAVWAKVDYDSLIFYDANQFLRTADGGKTWRLDSVDAPNGYGLSDISPIDANTCYAALYNAFAGLGGGIFKTADGGDTWKQIDPGTLFSDNSFPDFVYFFDAQHGLAVGDDDGTDTSRLEIYTTGNAGKTWQRVPKQNIPPTAGYVFSSNFNSYAVFQNRFWFTASDSYGNNYFYRSDDFGQHWQQFPYTLATPVYDFAFTDKQNGLGVSFDAEPHEVETHDGGKTWADKSFTGYPMGLFITVVPFTHTYVSTIPQFGNTPVTGSSYSNDFGATWRLIDSSSDFNPFAVAFLNPLVGWSGRGDSPDPNGGTYKWEYNFSLDNNAVAANINANSLSITKNDVSNSIPTGLYPNPSKDVITINGLNTSAKTTLSLFSISGKLIQLSTSGNESYQINIQKLAAGSYYVRIQSGEKITTLKFVKE